jgi:hypothetical protein
MKLFPGTKQYDRFRKLMSRITHGAELLEQLERRGVNPDDLGTHSMRKDATTFCASACPPTMAISLRAGWTNKGVHDTYMRCFENVFIILSNING